MKLYLFCIVLARVGSFFRKPPNTEICDSCIPPLVFVFMCQVWHHFVFLFHNAGSFDNIFSAEATTPTSLCSEPIRSKRSNSLTPPILCASVSEEALSPRLSLSEHVQSLCSTLSPHSSLNSSSSESQLDDLKTEFLQKGTFYDCFIFTVAVGWTISSSNPTVSLCCFNLSFDLFIFNIGLTVSLQLVLMIKFSYLKTVWQLRTLKLYSSYYSELYWWYWYIMVLLLVRF